MRIIGSEREKINFVDGFEELKSPPATIEEFFEVDDIISPDYNSEGTPTLSGTKIRKQASEEPLKEIFIIESPDELHKEDFLGYFDGPPPLQHVYSGDSKESSEETKIESSPIFADPSSPSRTKDGVADEEQKSKPEAKKNKLANMFE